MSNTPNLPTRDDDKIVFEQVSHVQEVQDIARRVAAHTRERCAKWHDEQVSSLQKEIAELDARVDLSDLDKQWLRDRAEFRITMHEESGAAFQAMED